MEDGVGALEYFYCTAYIKSCRAQCIVYSAPYTFQQRHWRTTPGGQVEVDNVGFRHDRPALRDANHLPKQAAIGTDEAMANNNKSHGDPESGELPLSCQQ